MSRPVLTRQVELLQAVADPNRLRILGCLLVRPACVCELMQALGIPQPRISRHLRILKSVGLVQDRREAQWVEYSLAPAPEGSLEAQVLGLVEKLLASEGAAVEDRRRLAAAKRSAFVPIEAGRAISARQRAATAPE